MTGKKTISDLIAEHGAKEGEMVDVVDVADNVLRQVSRVKAMQEGLRHRYVQILVFTPDRQLWVQWRSRHKVIAPRVFGTSAGGAVEAGQSYEEAAYRELEEELGIKDVALAELGRYTIDTPMAYNGAVFACQYEGDDLAGWEEEADVLDLMNEEEVGYLLARHPYLFSDGLATALEMLEKTEEE